MARSEEEIGEIMLKFVEVMNVAITNTFGEEGFPEDLSAVTGIHFDGTEGCHLISNLNFCTVPGVLNDMLRMAVEEHGRYHEQQGHEVTERVPEESVPADVREAAEAVAARYGVDEIIYTETVDVSDLDDLL